MAYPNLPNCIGSKEKRLDGRTVDRASNGGVRARSFFSAVKREWSVVHSFTSTANKEALEAFYEANKLTPFMFTWFGATYTVIFAETPPQYDPLVGGLWDITVTLAEV